MRASNEKLRRELSADLAAGNFGETEAGLLFPRSGVQVRGLWRVRKNGGPWEMARNKITTEGFAHILNVAFGNTPKPARYFLALFSGNADPQLNWTAATFPTVASEVVSLTEGYTSATRPQWQPPNTSGQTIDNFGNEVRVTFATASQVTVTGAAILTDNVRGGGSGVLVSALKYPAPYTFQDGNTFDLGYRIELTQ